MTAWFHSIELAPGEVTPGRLDTRELARKVPLPSSMSGTRCLDVGTRDGFWAFEMERRGAYEVVAVDLDEPGAVVGGREGFAIARDRLGSRVERQSLPVGELDPTTLGHFDVVFVGSLLAYLRDPVLALERVRSVCAGAAVIAETVELLPSLRYPRKPVARLAGLDRAWWWQPNRAALLRMIQSAGFEIEHVTQVSFVPRGAGHPRVGRRSLPRKLVTAQGREEIVVALRGVPHVAVRARPVGR